MLVDGSDPNTAGLVPNYVQGVWSNWLQQEAFAQGASCQRDRLLVIRPSRASGSIPKLDSQYSLLPGAVAIILTLIGTLLTSLVVAREWERGTMEALLATPVSVSEFLLGQAVPYFALGMAAMAWPVAVTVFGFGVPFRGSILAADGRGSVPAHRCWRWGC